MFLAGVLAGILAPSAALADPGEWLLAGELGGALFTGGAGPAVGAGGEIAVLTGLTDLFWLGLAGGVTALHEGPFRGFGLGELALLFDVLRTVPFAELGLGAELYDGRASPLIRLGIGADYLVSSELGLGVVVRYQPAFTEENEHLFSVGLRIVLRPID